MAPFLKQAGDLIRRSCSSGTTLSRRPYSGCLQRGRDRILGTWAPSTASDRGHNHNTERSHFVPSPACHATNSRNHFARDTQIAPSIGIRRGAHPSSKLKNFTFPENSIKQEHSSLKNVAHRENSSLSTAHPLNPLFSLFHRESSTMSVAVKEESMRVSHEEESSRVSHHSQLVREFIHESLYHPEFGYFSTQPDSVGSLQKPINFTHLSGQAEYTTLLQRLYIEHDVAWFTPSELFQPWYGYAVADFILAAHKRQHQHQGKAYQNTPLKIYETGAGNGTCAADILDHLKTSSKESSSSLYKNTKYTTLEISAALAARQKSHLEASGHGSCFTVVNGSAADPTVWGEKSEEVCFVLLFEVLDNLPHDRVVWDAKYQTWKETAVDYSMITSASSHPHSLNPSAHPHSSTPSAHSKSLTPSQAWKETAPRGTGAAIHPASHSHILTPSTRSHTLNPSTHSHILKPSTHSGTLNPTQRGPELSFPTPQYSTPSLSYEHPSAHSSPDPGSFQERLQALSDPVISEALEIHKRTHGGSVPPHSSFASSLRSWTLRTFLGLRDDIVWLPTTCLKLLQTIYTMRPNAIVIAADFNFLPDVQIEGCNAPLVSSKMRGQTVDSSTYLMPWGSSDIFFPTDFALLAELDKEAASKTRLVGHKDQGLPVGHADEPDGSRKQIVVPSKEFLRRFSQKGETKDGFNPMIHDFANTSFFVSIPQVSTSAL